MSEGSGESARVRDQLKAVLAGRYAVTGELGRGGMASVWLADDVRHQRPVAIKVLHPELAGAIGIDRFLREVRVTARLQHPNVIPVLDSGSFTGPDGVELPWYAMPYVAGESLRARLQRERQLPIEDAIRITEEAAAALMAAHREGFVHRDIKPENLLLAGGHVYVADFGVAKALMDTGGERLTRTGLAVGTPAYMSPEQASAEAVDARTDQYSLASVLYEMLAGEPPFTGPTSSAVVARRLAEPARALRPVRSAVPLELEAAILRALERVPADRFTDIGSFAAALRRVGVTAEAPHAHRARVFQWAGAAVVLGALVLGGWFVSRGGRPVRRDPEAVALYRRGLQEYDTRTPAGARAAIQSFTAAVRRDSTWAEPWTGLAMTYVRVFERGFVLPGISADSVLRLAVTAANRALSLDRGNSDAWVAQGIVSKKVDPTDVQPSVRALRQALALDSANAVAWHYFALGLAETGDLGAAIGAWRRSVAADPTYTMGLSFLALGHYWRQQFDSATRWADSAVSVDPTFLLGRTTAGQVAAETGDSARGTASFDAARRLATDVEFVNTLAGTAVVEARRGATRDARRTLQRAESLAAGLSPIQAHTAVYVAQAYAALGDRDRAVAWLRRYATRADLHFQLHLRCDPPLMAIHDDARVRALMLPQPVGCR